MNMQSLFKNIITLGSIGYWPASGTIASILTLPIVLFFHMISLSLPMFIVIIFFLFIFSAIAIQVGSHNLQEHDPSEIVIDEVLGCLITFFAIPLTYSSAVLGVIFFRLFDIAKIFGIERLERFQSPWGILLDDIGAAVAANLVLQVLILLRVI